MHEYFFELLTEEIPAWMIPARLEILAEQLRTFYAEFAGQPPAKDAIVVGATSRRIFLSLRGIPDKQPDREEEVKGPSVKAAYDATKKPTAALSGFLRKNNSSLESVSVRDDYVWIRRRVKGATAAEAIARALPPVIEGLRWPKMMRWGQGEHAFIRPIHSVVSAFDGAPVPIEIFGVRSGVKTQGHRIFANRTVEVKSFQDYRKKLRELQVVAEPAERLQAMRTRAQDLAAEIGGQLAVDQGIWDQWTFLTEHPGVIRAEFNAEFLSLPVEVLVTVMRVHQKQLPILRDGKLVNAFLAIMDGPRDADGNVASGNAFVTNARFADARFFYEVDRKRPMEDRVPQLSHLQFQEKLGDYGRKTERIVKLAKAIEDTAEVREAAKLCKTDLVTEMVKEFTDLQGKIGGIYAREEGKPEPVWQAIYDHYLPTSLDGELPRGKTGAVIALADKIDTLCGFFNIGLKPSGSRDPFALRRAAQGAVQILLTRQPWTIDMPLEALLDLGFAGYNSAAAREDLRAFIAERVRTLLETNRYGGFAYDEISAVMESGWSNSLLDLTDRAEALRAVRSSPEFLSILDSAKRIANITGNAASGSIAPALLQHPTEKRLAKLADSVSEQIDGLIGSRQYRAAFESFAGMAPELEKFFVDVLVMVEDEKLRSNRMALLRKVGSAVSKIADVTKVVVDRSEYAPTA